MTGGTGDIFTCEGCGQTFEKEWSDSEAMAESREIFGDNWKQEDLAVICDDCFKGLGLAPEPKPDVSAASPELISLLEGRIERAANQMAEDIFGAGSLPHSRKYLDLFRD